MATKPGQPQQPQQQQIATEDDERELTELCTRFLQCCEADAQKHGGANGAAAVATADSSSSSSPAAAALSSLRKRLLLRPMPEHPKLGSCCSLRGHVWLLLLGAPVVPAQEYLSLVSRGPCLPRELYSKIRGDVFRTFQDDAAFWKAVDEPQLSRVLNAFVWNQAQTKWPTEDGEEKPSPFTYLQGLNALCGAFLSCMSEAAALSALTRFVCHRTPLYWLSSHIGANAGCKLVDQVLAVVDPVLAAHLAATTPGAYVYAFHAVSGFCATIRPLEQVLRLWDFLLAVGPHFNVLCVAAQVVLLREALLASENPKAILDYRVWPRLDAARTVRLAMAFLPLLPTGLYEDITRHATHAQTAERISHTNMHENAKGLLLGPGGRE